MGIISGAFKFMVGGAVGTAAGAGVALLLAPESGRDLQASLRKRIRDAKIAGAEAQVAKENELIRKYRLEIKDSGALTDAEQAARKQRDEALSAIG